MKKFLVFVGIIFTVSIFTGCSSVGNKDVVQKIKATASLSGKIPFLGLKPDVGEKGIITIAVRKHGTEDMFEKVNLVVKPLLVDNAAWTWDRAMEGETYDMQATLVVDTKKVAVSQIQTVTAPAASMELPLQVTWSALPLKDREKSFQKIGGNIEVSGYIPAGATTTIYTAKARDNSELNPEEVDDPQFRIAVKNVVIKNNKKWYWGEALGQIDYLVKSEMHNAAGKLIGTSDIIRVMAPNESALMHIVSRATAPIQNASISGAAKLNGSYKKDSTIEISVRENSTGGFKIIDSFSAESSRKWEYKKAKNGIEYDVRATLMQKGEEVARSSQKHVFAPAKNIKLKIDTGMDLDDPNQMPYIVECKKKDKKKYDAKITFPGIGDARAYWVKIGTSKHSGSRFNEAERPKATGKDLTVKVRVNKNKKYYVEYAYSYCKDCETQDSFSEFSDHIKFSCPE